MNNSERQFLTELNRLLEKYDIEITADADNVHSIDFDGYVPRGDSISIRLKNNRISPFHINKLLEQS